MAALSSLPIELRVDGTKRRSFPFDLPLHRDWLFWWALVIVPALGIQGAAHSGSNPIIVGGDLALSAAVALALYVLVPSLVRKGVRTFLERPRGTQPGPRTNVVRVTFGARRAIVFRIEDDGRRTVSSLGFGGKPGPQLVGRAAERGRQAVRRRCQEPWF